MTDDRVNFRDTHVGRHVFTAAEQVDAFQKWANRHTMTRMELEWILRLEMSLRDPRRYAAYACAEYMIKKMKRAGVITYSGKKWHLVGAQK